MLAGMTATMFLLLQAAPGSADTLASLVADIPGVGEAVVTSGPYDVIAWVDAPGQVATRSVIEAVRGCQGLSRLCVCWPQSEARSRLVGTAR